MTLGGVGLGALVGVASTSSRTFHYRHSWWFLVPVIVAGIVLLAGFYVVLAGVVSWLPPRSWTHRVQPEQFVPRHVTFSGPGKVSARDVESSADSVTHGGTEAEIEGLRHRPGQANNGEDARTKEPPPGEESQ